MRKIGFIGLGNMGKGICHQLIEKGNELFVFDLNKDAMSLFKDQATLCENIEEVCRNSEVIFLSLPNSKVVEATVDTFIQVGIEGKLIVDLSTSDPTSTRALYQKVKDAKGDLVDSPLIAGPQEAWDGTLTIVLGGDEEVVKKYDDLFNSYCKGYKYMGPSGNGHLVKLAQNWAGLSQAIMYAQIYAVMDHYGIPPKELYEALNSEFFDNWFFQFYSKKYIEKNYHMDFALKLGLKDLTYMKKLCDDMQCPGFMLDGAIDLCRVALKEGADKGIVQDMSHVGDTMYEYAKK